MLAGNHGIDQRLRLLKAKYDLHKVVDDFEAAKASISERMSAFEARKIEFETKQKDMAEQVQHFENFIFDNDEKLKRSCAAIKSEQRAQRDKREELEILIVKLRKCKYEKEEVLQKVEKLSQYSNFVALLHDDIEQLFRRAKVLITSNQELRSDLHFVLKETSKIQSEIPELIEYYNANRAIPLQEAQELQEKLDIVRTKAKCGRHELREQMNRQVGEEKERSKVLMAIRNMHRSCSQISRMKMITLDETKDDALYLCKCLDSIRDQLQDLSEIVREFEHENSSSVS
eukprot:CAMPEP_0116059762 /NCGR_PEP_ID=MMETSP0322-20121206/5994_1 /TAXON_ID=163516 /ORGANISM="Leptocylindrus danicus var. apora, Strain B651" /LENGTH=286 /DNA_ID=CAMNT_0003544215 /DNA_START=1247 /DNA_END=2107 /DNA_ORIENTATION=-